MKRSSFRIFLMMGLVSALYVTAGCEEDESGVSVNVTNENFCIEIAEVTCKNAFQCCTGLELETNYGIEITTTENECRRDIELRCENIYSELIYSINAETAELATEEIETCFELLLAPDDSCFPYMSTDELITACTVDMIVGNQGSGEDCLFDFECPEEAYCGPDRKCAALPTVGETCPGFVCATGLYCGFDFKSGDFICFELAASGEMCVDSSDCAEGLYCNMTGTCESLLDLGDSCDDDGSCDSGFCLPGICEDDGSECYDGMDCGTAGSCENTFASCNSDVDCTYDTCSNTGTFCKDMTDCGRCANTGWVCTATKDCNAYDPYDICEFGTCDAETCVGAVPGNCEGDPVCAENWSTLNYCSLSPLGVL